METKNQSESQEIEFQSRILSDEKAFHRMDEDTYEFMANYFSIMPEEERTEFHDWLEHTNNPDDVVEKRKIG